MEKNTGKVREICQPKNVETMPFNVWSEANKHGKLHWCLQYTYVICSSFLCEPKFGNNFGGLVRRRNNVTKLTAHRKCVFADTLIL